MSSTASMRRRSCADATTTNAAAAPPSGAMKMATGGTYGRTEKRRGPMTQRRNASEPMTKSYTLVRSARRVSMLSSEQHEQHETAELVLKRALAYLQDQVNKKKAPEELFFKNATPGEVVTLREWFERGDLTGTVARVHAQQHKRFMTIQKEQYTSLKSIIHPKA